MENSNSFLKWIGGIIGAIITAVAIWWLTGSNSPFTANNSTPPTTKAILDTDTTTQPIKAPQIVITNFTLKNPINIGETTTAEFTVENQGNATSTGCQIIWNTPGLNGTKTSEQFDLQPGEKKNIEMVSNPFDKQGTYSCTASLSCGNTETITQTKELVVNFMISPHAVHISP